MCVAETFESVSESTTKFTPFILWSKSARLHNILGTVQGYYGITRNLAFAET